MKSKCCLFIEIPTCWIFLRMYEKNSHNVVSFSMKRNSFSLKDTPWLKSLMLLPHIQRPCSFLRPGPPLCSSYCAVLHIQTLFQLLVPLFRITSSVFFKAPWMNCLYSWSSNHPFPFSLESNLIGFFSPLFPVSLAVPAQKLLLVSSHLPNL